MAPRSGTRTREKLLDAAEGMILDQGYAATSVDQIIDKVGLTKGSFFYHFKTKNDLARALIDRHAQADRNVLTSTMERAEKLGSDPLQQLLIFVGLLVELAEQLDTMDRPGCLFASYCYESGLFDQETHEVLARAIYDWRSAIATKLRAAAAEHPPKIDVDLDSLADMATVVFEGAFIVSRSVKGSDVFVKQLSHYRDYLRLLFGA